MHLCLFLKRKPRFSLLSCTSFSFKYLCYNYFLLKVHNHPLSKCHRFTLFSHNRHDDATIPVLVNIFSIRSSSLKNKLLCITSVHLIFKGKVKYTLRMKNPRMNNPQPPFPFPIHKLRSSDTSSPKTFMTKFTFFVPNIRL